MAEAPDIREQEDCPGAKYCDGRCDQHRAAPDAPRPADEQHVVHYFKGDEPGSARCGASVHPADRYRYSDKWTEVTCRACQLHWSAPGDVPDPLLCPGDGCGGCFHCTSTTAEVESDASRPAANVTGVLAAHEIVWNAGMYGALGHYACKGGCGWYSSSPNARDLHRAHVAAALAEAGIGPVAEAVTTAYHDSIVNEAQREIHRLEGAVAEAEGWREQAMEADASTPEPLRLARSEGAQAVLAAVESLCSFPEHRNWKSKQLLDAARSAAAAARAAAERGAS